MMVEDIEKIIERAKELTHCMEDRNLTIALAWLSFIGLVRTNFVSPKKEEVTLEILLEAGKIEPRVYQLLPAIMNQLSFAIQYNEEEVPKDLNDVLRAIESGGGYKEFRGIVPKRYIQWIQSPAIEIAKRRLSPKGGPRNRDTGNREVDNREMEAGDTKESISSMVRSARLDSGFTQKHLANRYGISLRALRDLEQGYDNVSLGRAMEILSVLGKRIMVIDR